MCKIPGRPRPGAIEGLGWGHLLLYTSWGRVHDFSFFDCSSPLCFLLIEFHCNFSISYKNTTILLLLYFDYVVIGRRNFFFFRTRFTSFQNYASFLTFSSVSFSNLILAVLTSSTVPIAVLNDTCFFRQFNYKCTMYIRSEKVEILNH